MVIEYDVLRRRYFSRQVCTMPETYFPVKLGRGYVTLANGLYPLNED